MFYITPEKGSSLFLDIILGAVLAPIIEEFLFRGILFQHLLKTNINIVIALLFQAAVFGVVHRNPMKNIFTFFLGIVLGLVYIWTKSIWASILVHAVNNLESTIEGYEIFRPNVAWSGEMILVKGAWALFFTMLFLFVIWYECVKEPAISCTTESAAIMLTDSTSEAYIEGIDDEEAKFEST